MLTLDEPEFEGARISSVATLAVTLFVCVVGALGYSRLLALAKAMKRMTVRDGCLKNSVFVDPNISNPASGDVFVYGGVLPENTESNFVSIHVDESAYENDEERRANDVAETICALGDELAEKEFDNVTWVGCASVADAGLAGRIEAVYFPVWESAV